MTPISNFKLPTSRQQGFGIVEIIVAIAIMSIALFAISQLSIIYVAKETQNKQTLKANYLAEESVESARSVRDQSWSTNIETLTFGSPYYPVISGGKWTLSSSNPGPIDTIYTRQVVIDNVSRDAGDNIVTNGGTNDPNTKKITATVSWNSKSITLATYLTNLYAN